ncbi:integrating conjugative element protein [Pasteurella skyensis]|uniref:integrating conjugative element protein n=1 Tax=Phocoenobacter skyensis TaxID=97481 RepID=UPI00277AE72A|nr:integrating conjugative element protein [Pasteurella skyensis]MDP8189060.1 integrating conjugative element protein [Pasteurella skyensis]
MKKLNAITLGIILWSYSQTPLADTTIPTGYTTGTVLSDYVHYSIGGGAAISPPLSRQAPNVYSIGLGWRSNLTCGNFDIKLSIKNQLNGITEGFKDLYSNVIESATGAVASLPAMIIQRANPQLYDLLSNGLYQGKIDFNNLKTSCEEMSAKLADYAIDSKWAEMAGIENFKEIAATEPDVNKAKKRLERDKGKNGRAWIGGQKKGGQGQDPIDVIQDVVGAGYNMALGRSVTEKRSVSQTQCDGMICTEWSKPEEAAKYAREVLGGKTLYTCDTCGTPSSQPGRGLAPKIEKTTIEKANELETLLNSTTITAEQLNTVSTSTVAVTRGLIEALQQDPDAPILGARLAQELAISAELEKALALRRMILMGMKEPNVALNSEAQVELETALKRLDLEIEQVKLEMDLQKSINNNTAIAILNNRARNQLRSLDSNAPEQGNKHFLNLAGERSNSGEIRTPGQLTEGYIVIPKSLGTGLTNLYGSFAANAANGSSSYSPIAAISGTALEQAKGLLKNFEGFNSKAYWDVNAYRTGYGSDTITRADGMIVRVNKDTIVTQEDAERDLVRRTQIFANTVKSQISSSSWNKLTPSAQAALTSFAYNYGSLSKTKSIISAAQASANTGNMKILADAIRNRQSDNNGVNAKRRNQEADYILTNR